MGWICPPVWTYCNLRRLVNLQLLYALHGGTNISKEKHYSPLDGLTKTHDKWCVCVSKGSSVELSVFENSGRTTPIKIKKKDLEIKTKKIMCGGGFLSHRGTPRLIIHFERWDFPVHNNHPFGVTPMAHHPSP